MVLCCIIAVLNAYLLGNLNGAVCMSALFAHEDVRQHGSGNAGLTNFVRSYGAGKALYVILIDGGKAVLGCLCAGLMLEPFGCYMEGVILGGIAVLLGHIYPAVLGFRGGKGIMSGFAIAMVADWRIGLGLLLIFVVTYALTRYVSLGSILGAVGFCVGFAVFHHDSLFVMLGGIFMGLFTIWMHRANIQRLIKGTERKTNLFKNDYFKYQDIKKNRP